MMGGLTPEQHARVEIDRKLEAAGWVVQDFKAIDLSAAPGTMREPTLAGRPTIGRLGPIGRATRPPI
jgi:type I restriction enzyme R subunit